MDETVHEEDRWQNCARTAKVWTVVCISLAWIMGLFANQLQAATQPTLDLVCSPQRRQPIRFRFDLQQKKWCIGECQSVWFIDELGDSMIKLSLQTKDDSDYWSVNIDRYTSSFWIVRRGYGSEPQDWGQCKVEPFSGFPQKRF